MMNLTSLGGRVLRVLSAASILLACAVAELAAAELGKPSALKIGLRMDLSGGSAEVVRDRQRAFDLAIKHINNGGGVFGRPVATVVGDTTADPETGVAEARRLVEIEGVHAIVGPNSSANALAIAERVIGPAGVPTISFSATSPKLTTAADEDSCFEPPFPTFRRVRSSPESHASGASAMLACSISTGISHVAPFSQVGRGSKSLKVQVRWVLPPRSCPTTRN